MSNDPTRVKLSTVVEFLRGIGLDPVDIRNLRSVHFDPGMVTVIRQRRDENGHFIVVGEGDDAQVATETTLIAVDFK
jgi:hypothetical protein